MKDSFYLSLKRLFAVLLILNTIIITIIVYLSVNNYATQRKALTEMGYMVLRAFEASRPMLFRQNRGNSHLNVLLEEMFDLKTITNIVIYKKDGEVVFALRPHKDIIKTDVTGRQETETADTFTLYNTFNTARMMMGKPSGPQNPNGTRGNMPMQNFGDNGLFFPHMPHEEHMQRSDNQVFIAVSIDKAGLNTLKISSMVILTIAIIIELLIFFLYFRMRTLIRLYHSSVIQLKNAEKEAATGRLSSVLAHEIKNPLSSMSGLIDFAAQKTSDEQTSDILARVNGEVLRLSKIVNDFLSYGRSFDIETKSSSIFALIEKTCSLLTHDTGAKNISLNISGDDFFADIDENKMLQVFVNLILNAIEASPQGDIIKISLNPQAKTVSVANNVTTQATLDAEKAFEPFVTTKTKGSGLGLSITKRIVERHGYLINIENTNGWVVVINFAKVVSVEKNPYSR